MKLQVNSLRNDKDGMEMRDEIVMVHESDVFVNVGQSDVAEQGGYDAHMLHDMTSTHSMTHAMGGGDVVAELDNNRCTSRVTEIVCNIGHCSNHTNKHALVSVEGSVGKTNSHYRAS